MSIQKRYLSQGSSPHSRGTLCNNHFVIPTIRIIPAFAGNTMAKFANLSGIRDHPRIRGEHASMEMLKVLDEGSSPHSRGTLHSVTIPTLIPGIIPAFAGNTVPWTEKQLEYKDHPRIRGEHNFLCDFFIVLKGSSPHSRGTRSCLYAFYEHERIIPAFAGNTTLEIL